MTTDLNETRAIREGLRVTCGALGINQYDKLIDLDKLTDLVPRELNPAEALIVGQYLSRLAEAAVEASEPTQQ